jgi:plasmid stability protein
MGSSSSAHSLTVQFPSALCDRLARRAAQTQRSVEDEVLDLVISGVATADETEQDVSEISASLALLDDAALWQAARSRLTDEAATHLEGLHLKRQREGLTPDEEATDATLVRRYERTVFTRAQAAALLKARGYDVAPLLQQM